MNHLHGFLTWASLKEKFITNFGTYINDISMFS